MSVAVKLQVNGVAAAIRRMQDTEDLIERGTIRSVIGTAFSVQGRAKRMAAVDTGIMRAGIFVRFLNNGTAAEVVASKAYSIYVEEGTRHTKAPPPSALKDWVRRHGMPESAAFAISKAIQKRGGLQPRPFLVPAWETEKPKFVKKLEQVIENAAKRGG